MSDEPELQSLPALVKAWRFARLLLRPVLARRLGTLVTEGYLVEMGWVRSVISHELVDADGEAVPWMTQPFVDFLRPRIRSHWRVFEYGAGASTLFLPGAPRRCWRSSTMRHLRRNSVRACRRRPG
jgi:hypothetical protein